MPRIVALVAALVFVVSASSMVVAAGSDLNIVFDASRARVHQAGGGALVDGGGRPASDVATAFMQRHGRDDNTIATLRVDAMYIDHGITHLTFHQEVGGLQIAGAYAKAALNARGDLIHLIDNLVDVTGSAAPAQIDATQALAAAIATNLPTIGDRPGILHRSGSTATFQKTAAFRASPTAEQVLLARESGRLEKAFLVTTWTRQGNLLQRSLVDGSGVVAATELRTAYDSYYVYPENPSKGPQVLAPGPGSSSPYSPDGWLSGSQTTINIGGNNVHAYLDRDANNAADAGGSAVTDGNFLAVSDLATAPSTTGNQAVAVQSLFYLNNLLHDTLYAHGFTEATGNFQENNFGNGGSGSDSVNAEAQDGSGTDNANFATPADGQNPTMQMYLWTGPGGTHEVATGAGSYEAYGAAFGPALTTTGRTAPLSEVNDGTSPTTDACEALPRKSLTGKIAIVDRGVCTFTTKIKNAQAAGAVGVIVVNNAAGPAFTMGGSGSFRISAVMVAQADGALVRGQVPGSGTIRLKAIQPLQIDGDIDSDIVYHEYGHGLTWRMIGSMSGPMSGAIGEGASDVLAMLLNGNDVIGEYAFGDPKGIRSAPYGTLAKTYADVTGAEVHDDGEVLGAIGWSLIERYGSAGKTSTGLLDTWVQGFKYTPAGPKFEDMRDGMLAAAAALGRTDEHCLIWMAFAEFGVGVGASATVSRRGVITVTESFALPPECP